MAKAAALRPGGDSVCLGHKDGSVVLGSGEASAFHPEAPPSDAVPGAWRKHSLWSLVSPNSGKHSPSCSPEFEKLSFPFVSEARPSYLPSLKVFFNFSFLESLGISFLHGPL